MEITAGGSPPGTYAGPTIVVPVLADAERELLEQVAADWVTEVEDYVADDEFCHLIHDADTLRALARWADAREMLAKFLTGDAEIGELEPWADLYRDAMGQVLEMREELGPLGGSEPPR